MITPEDKELLAQKGISEVQIAEQLTCFQKGFPYLKLDAAASVEKVFWFPMPKNRKLISQPGMLIPILTKRL